MSDAVPRSRGPSAAQGPAAGPCLAAVRAAWHDAWDAADTRSAPLHGALRAYARDGRARGVPVQALLRALDSLLRRDEGGDPALDFDHVREWAGSEVIRAYYRDD